MISKKKKKKKIPLKLFTKVIPKIELFFLYLTCVTCSFLLLEYKLANFEIFTKTILDNKLRWTVVPKFFTFQRRPTPEIIAMVQMSNHDGYGECFFTLLSKKKQNKGWGDVLARSPLGTLLGSYGGACRHQFDVIRFSNSRDLTIKYVT